MELVPSQIHRRINGWAVYWLLVVVAVALATILSHDLSLGVVIAFLGILLGVGVYLTDLGGY